MPRGAWRDQPGAASQVPDWSGDHAARWRDQPGRMAPTDRAAPGSREDLRKRLDHLPDWHPSSSLEQGPAGSPRQRQPERDLAADHAPDADDGGYWSQVPRFERMWAEHLRRWPDAHTRAAVDRSRDPEGSWRGSGNQYLDPEQHKRVQQVIDSVRTAEKPLSEHMREIERENSCGSRLAGWESRLKGDTRLKEKVADQLKITPALSPDTALATINDAIRYTFCSDVTTYRDAYLGIKSQLETHGYRMIYSKNHWRQDQEYKGINTRWQTPDGHRFEVQFHTTESFHAKQEITHGSYERIRNPLTSDEERGELSTFQRTVYEQIDVPQATHEIDDFSQRGR